MFLLYFRLGFGVCCVIFQRRKLPSFIPSSNLGIPQRRKQTRCQMTSWLSPWWRRWGLVPLFPLGVMRSRGPACFSSEIHRCGKHPRQPPSVLLSSVSPRNSHPRFPVFCLSPPTLGYFRGVFPYSAACSTQAAPRSVCFTSGNFASHLFCSFFFLSLLR